MFKNYDTNKHDTFHNSEMICPYCGEEIVDSFEYDDGEDEEAHCPNCRKDFKYSTETERKFTTYCIKHTLITDKERETEVIGGETCRYYHCENCDYTAWLDDNEAKENSETIIEDYNWKHKDA